MGISSRIRLVAVGDISLRTTCEGSPFQHVETALRDKDILFGNLETVLSEQGVEQEKVVNIHTSPDKARYLCGAGFDIVNIANNHIMDLGQEGFDETLEVLTSNKIHFVGAGNRIHPERSVIIEKKGKRFGFLGYTNSGFNSNGIFLSDLKERDIIADIKGLKDKCDHVIVSLHWGVENVFYPAPKQIRLARRLIDSGAALLLGGHPHFVQGIERYGHGLIVYSLGNFQFHSLGAPATSESMIFAINFDGPEIGSYELYPVLIGHDYLPRPVSGIEAERLSRRMGLISEPIVNGKLNELRWFKEIGSEYLRESTTSFMFRIRKYGAPHFIQFIRWIFSRFTMMCCVGALLGLVIKNEKKPV
jgi:poly-gamma-glutamate capsule biosynthesis protein CapA/YwtB (metallophosphatase superfamily)